MTGIYCYFGTISFLKKIEFHGKIFWYSYNDCKKMIIFPSKISIKLYRSGKILIGDLQIELMTLPTFSLNKDDYPIVVKISVYEVQKHC